MNRRDFLKTSVVIAGTTFVTSKMGLTSSMLGATGNSSGIGKSADVPNIVLNNDSSIPQLGFGVWTLAEATTPSVTAAVESGYRLFDTAQAYGNEKETYQGIKNTGIARSDVFITTKISPDNMRTPPQQQSIDESIELLGGEYIDLMLLHWPVKDHIQETWGVMEDYVKKGLIRNLGISNFNPHHIEDLLKYANIKPVLNQIEIHPYHSQQVNIAATQGFNIAVQAWSPLAQGRVVTDENIMAIARKHGKSPAQVTLRWEIQRGLIVIPRSKNKAHISENIDIFDFELDSVDMAVINGLNQNQRINPKNDPDNFPW